MKGRKTGGRKKGSVNKLTSDVRDMVLTALDKAGGTDYLRQQAAENPGPFLALVARCLPKEIRAEVSAEMVVRQEVRRDLIESLMQELILPHALELPAGSLPAIAHESQAAPRIVTEEKDSSTTTRAPVEDRQAA